MALPIRFRFARFPALPVAVLLSAVAVLCGVLVIGPAEAGIVTWDGDCVLYSLRLDKNTWAAGCSLPDGQDGTNWDNESLPDATDDVIISAAAGETVIDGKWIYAPMVANTVNSSASLRIRRGAELIIMSETGESAIKDLVIEQGKIDVRHKLILTGQGNSMGGTPPYAGISGNVELDSMGTLDARGYVFIYGDFVNRGTVNQTLTFGTNAFNKGTWTTTGDYSSGGTFVNSNGASLEIATQVRSELYSLHNEGGNTLISSGTLLLKSSEDDQEPGRQGSWMADGTIQIAPSSELEI